MPVNRNPQPLMQPTKLRKSTTQAESFAPVTQIGVKKDSNLSALSTLTKILPDLAGEIGGELDRIAEEDATRQTSRALNGMEPDKDATKAGREAHRMVGVRNQTNQAINKLNDEAGRFIGNQSEWEDHVANTQSQLLDEIGADEATVKVTGAIFREQLPKSHLIKFRADQVRDQAAKYESTVESFQGALGSEFDETQYKANVAQVMMDESKSMGLGAKQTEKALIDAAIRMSVENDDLRLMNITKELGLFNKSSALQSASSRAETRITKREAGDIAIQKQNLIDEFIASPTMSWKEVAGKAQNQRNLSGNPIWSTEQILALQGRYDRAQVAHDKRYVVNDMYAQSLLGDMEGGTFTGDSQGIRAYPDTSILTKSQKKDMVELYNDDYYTNINRLGAQFADDPTKLNTLITETRNNKATWLANTGLKDDKWEKDFDIIGNFTKEAADNLPSGQLPDTIKQSIGLYEDLQGSPGTLANHASDRAVSVAENFKANMDSGGYTEQQALSAAISQADAPKVSLTKEETKKFNERVKSETLGAYDKWFFDEGEDATSNQVIAITNKANDRASTLMNTGVPQDKAIERALAEIKDTHIQLSNGQPVYGNYEWLASKMRVPVNQSAIDNILVNLHSRLDAMADEEGMEDFIPNAAIGTESKDWSMEITSGGFIVYRDVYGFPVTKPIHLGEAAGLSIEQMKKQNRDIFDSARENRLKHEKQVSSSVENINF